MSIRRSLLGIMAFLVYNASVYAQVSWEHDPLNWWDRYRHIARLSYDFDEWQNSTWLSDEDASAMRGTVGSISTIAFFDHEDARLVFPLSERFVARYLYTREQDYGVDSSKSRFEIEYRDRRGWLAGLLGTAFHHKENMDAGAFVGYMKTPHRFIRLRWIGHRFLYNVKNQEKGRYSTFPFEFQLELRAEPHSNTRLFVDAFYELPSAQTIGSPPTTDDAIHREHSNALFSLRTEHQRPNGLHGISFLVQRERVAESFSRNVCWSRREISARFIVFYGVEQARVAWRVQVPVRYDFEKLGRTIGDATRSRDRTSWEIYPNLTARRSLGKLPFAEGTAMLLARNLSQTGDLYEARSALQGVFRIGAALGLASSGGEASVSGVPRRLPRGEMKLKAWQDVGRKFSSSFGGGQFAVVLVL